MNRSLIPALQKDETLLEDIHRADSTGESFSVWWLGQSGFLLKWKDQHVLFDPYLSDSLTAKYAQTNKPHERISEKVIDPGKLNFIDIVTSSHNHTDHLDAETIIPILRNNPQVSFIIPEANRQFVAERMKTDPKALIGLDDKKPIIVGPFTIHGIPSAHNEVDRDENGNPKYMGYVFEFGKWKIYHSGDTLYFVDMVRLLAPFNLDLALLPINGNDPARGVAGNLDTRAAAELGFRINSKMVIPCHYDLFAFNTANPEDFARIADQLSQPYKILKLGEKWNSNQIKG